MNILYYLILCFLLCTTALADTTIPGEVNHINITLHQLCAPGYSGTIRPSSSYTNKIKRYLIIGINTKEKDSGIPLTRINGYELDHKLPLSLNGNPTSLNNLWMQKWVYAKIKDVTETRLHNDVCSGKTTLEEAQKIMLNWKDN